MSPSSHVPRALVTGGAGFLGSHLCDRLLSEGYEVLVLDSLITGRMENIAHLQDDPRFHFRQCDVAEGIDETGPLDIVFHAASPASPVDYTRHPVETLRAGSLGTWNALETAAAHRARFVLFSTSEIYGDPAVHPQSEGYWGNVNPVGARSVYDEAKRFSEALTAAYRRARSLHTGIVRIFNAYGPRMRLDDGRLVPNLIVQALRGEPLTVYGDGRQTRSFCYVSDLIDGIWRMAVSREAGPINIGNPDERSVLEVAERIAGLVSGAVRIEHRPLPTAEDPRRRCPDITRARAVLGWEPVTSLDEGLRQTIRSIEAVIESRTSVHGF